MNSDSASLGNRDNGICAMEINISLRLRLCSPVTIGMLSGVLLLCGGVVGSRPARGDEALAAVAANFIETARELGTAFSRESGDKVRFSSGSTGMLYAQIINGAPYDIFLAADNREPEKLVTAGLALAETRFTYAIGSLVVWSAEAARIRGDCAALLKSGDFKRVAMANPDVAPYGMAAMATLQAWDMWESLAPRLLRSESVGQAFQFVATGNAELGFIAYSQVLGLPRNRAGSFCIVNPALYPPLRQQAVLLHHGAANGAARRFMEFLRGKQGVAIIRKFGYQIGAP